MPKEDVDSDGEVAYVFEPKGDVHPKVDVMFLKPGITWRMLFSGFMAKLEARANLGGTDGVPNKNQTSTREYMMENGLVLKTWDSHGGDGVLFLRLSEDDENFCDVTTISGAHIDDEPYDWWAKYPDKPESHCVEPLIPEALEDVKRWFFHANGSGQLQRMYMVPTGWENGKITLKDYTPDDFSDFFNITTSIGPKKYISAVNNYRGGKFFPNSAIYRLDFVKTSAWKGENDVNDKYYLQKMQLAATSDWLLTDSKRIKGLDAWYQLYYIALNHSRYLKFNYYDWRR